MYPGIALTAFGYHTFKWLACVSRVIDTVYWTRYTLAEWKAANPDAAWIVGGSYDATFAPGGRFDARWLDEVTGDTPTVLRSWDYHTAWVNTAALDAA